MTFLKNTLTSIQEAPNDPDIIREYANRMHEEGSLIEAAKYYERAAKIYISEGKLLQANVSKIFQWRLKPPSYEHTHVFYSEHTKCEYENIPLNKFLTNFSYQEWIHFISQLEYMRLPPGQKIRSIGEEEDNLYCIISGNLKDSLYLFVENSQKRHRDSDIFLSKNEVFGNIYPFFKKISSNSYTETVNWVELVKISKNDLIELCNNFPDFEAGIINLLNIRSGPAGSEPFSAVRKEKRYNIRLRSNLIINSKEPENQKLILKGRSENISRSGMCFVLNSDSSNISYDISFLKRKINWVMPLISFSTRFLLFRILGQIVWSSEVVLNGEKTLTIGIKFVDMPSKLKNRMFDFLIHLGDELPKIT